MSSAWYHSGSNPPTARRASRLNIEQGPMAKLVRRGRARYFAAIRRSVATDQTTRLLENVRPRPPPRPRGQRGGFVLPCWRPNPPRADVNVRDRHPFASGLLNGPLPSSRQPQRGLVMNPDGDPVVSLGVVMSIKDGLRSVGRTVIHDQNFG